MTNSENQTPNQPEENEPPGQPPPGEPKRPDRSGSSNLFWWLMVAVGIVGILVLFSSNRPEGETLKFAALMSGLPEKKGDTSTPFHQNNVYELVISLSDITFQDQPNDPQTGSPPKDTKYYRVAAIGMDGDRDKLVNRLSDLGIEYKYASQEPAWKSLAYLVLISLMFLLVFVFLFRRIGGAGSAMSFARSRGKLFAQEEIEITFSDVAGIEEAVEELREVVEFLRTPEKYQALGGRIPRGVLLVGPPGTGKTLLAKAVAGEAGVPFFSLSGSDFVEMFVGVGAARVRDMFQQAGQRSPSIIFIDELDALGKVRGSGMAGGHDEREQTLNALLVEMDGFSSDQSVIVMAATNRPETLDPALMRPGRFDRHVLVDRPDVKGREAILKVHATKIKMDDGVNLQRLAKLTPGFVGADLANIVNEAALLAARNDKTKVSMDEFEEGIERVVAGLKKQTRIIQEDEKQRVAYHECGHALVACSLPNTDPVHKISIIPRGFGALGYTLQLPDDERQLNTQSELESRICVLLGGIATEDIVFKEISTGAQNDLQRATDIARRMVTDFGMSPLLGRVHYSENQRSPFMGGAQPMAAEPLHSENTLREIDLEVRRILDEASKTVHDILISRREALDHLSKELMECEVMDADQLKQILDEHQTGPQIKPGTFAAKKDRHTDETHRASDEAPPSRGSVDGA